MHVIDPLLIEEWKRSGYWCIKGCEGVMRDEKEMWKQYNKVTEHKEAYYREKERASPQIVNAYITFRSMEGKERAL